MVIAFIRIMMIKTTKATTTTIIIPFRGCGMPGDNCFSFGKLDADDDDGGEDTASSENEACAVNWGSADTFTNHGCLFVYMTMGK